MKNVARGYLGIFFGSGRAAGAPETAAPARAPLPYARKYAFLSAAETAFARRSRRPAVPAAEMAASWQRPSRALGCAVSLGPSRGKRTYVPRYRNAGTA